MDFSKFETRSPSHQNAVDIFKERWASNLDCIAPGIVAGDALHFAPEPRINHAARTLGRHGRLDGMSILELGPLDGGQTYRLETLGGNVLAIEANAEAYLKCLVVKEIACMKSRFMFGNFVPYLATTDDRFDIIVASGVLYHMTDPISVIQNIARLTDKCFVWAATYDPTRPKAPPVKVVTDDRFPSMEFYSIEYGESRNDGRFWGGTEPTSVWMKNNDMLRIFQSCGFTKIEELNMAPSDSHSVICFSARK